MKRNQNVLGVKFRKTLSGGRMDAEEKVDRTVEKAWKSACILRKIYKRKEGGIKNRKFDNTCVMCIINTSKTDAAHQV